MDFIIIEYVMEYEKFIDMVLDSTLQLIFKEQYLENFGITLLKNIQSYLKRLLNTPFFSQLHIFVRLYFLHIFQPILEIAID